MAEPKQLTFADLPAKRDPPTEPTPARGQELIDHLRGKSTQRNARTVRRLPTVPWRPGIPSGDEIPF